MRVNVGTNASSEFRYKKKRKKCATNASQHPRMLGSTNAESRRNFCSKFFPRSVFYVQLTCIIVIIGLFITIMFGRSITAAILGTIGIIMSLETYFSASRNERWFLKYYAIFMVLFSAASIVVGSTVLSGVDIECAGASNQQACTTTQLMYGLIMTLGSSSVGMFAAINAALVFYATRGAPEIVIDKKLE
jgi:hypothetical protein